MNEVTVTIFTPTFNRSHLLKRLYQSLHNQSNYDFEWIVYDDCSTDDTIDYVKMISNLETQFSIQLIAGKTNGGKHRAINSGIKYAKGKLFFIVDSDDELVETAIEQIVNREKELEKDQRFAGLGFCKGYLNNTLVGTSFEGDYLDCTSLERDKYNIIGDKAEVFYTNVLKKFPFPEYEGELFLTEAVVWDRIAHENYKIRWINSIIYLCEYQVDGLSSKWNDNLRKNKNGYTIFLKQRIEYGLYTPLQKYLFVKGYYNNLNFDGFRVSVSECCKRLNYSIIKFYCFELMQNVKRLAKLFLSIFFGDEK